jgi:DNA-binding transcriptional ArsR family regulator
LRPEAGPDRDRSAMLDRRIVMQHLGVLEDAELLILRRRER